MVIACNTRASVWEVPLVFYLYIDHFFIKPSKICFSALIFLLCDEEELNYVLFSWYTCDEARYEFGAEILKVNDGAKLQAMVSCSSKSVKYCLKDFTHNIVVLYYKFQVILYILYLFF